MWQLRIAKENILHLQLIHKCFLLQFTVELKSLSSSEGILKQFLISINPDSERLDENCLSEGTLESLSDKSQHTSYSCFKYLVNRPEKEEVWEGGNVGSTGETF